MSDSLKQLLNDREKDLFEQNGEKILHFYDLVLQENKVQNLTRLIGPADFYFGHIQDVVELLKTRWIEYPALDLGSGVGVPGILAALIEKEKWILAESEKRKAEYLKNTVSCLSLNTQVSVFSGRAEDYLKNHSVKSVVVRAVGSVERIYSWIRRCSTWNNLILMKGPSWDEEWGAFQKTKFGHELKILGVQGYKTGPEGETRTRTLVKIGRVPYRGSSTL